MKNIVLFASGGGSNAEKIMEYFAKKDNFDVVGLFTNNPNAGAIDRAKNYNVPVFVFNREELNSDIVLKKVQALNPDIIVLAGFLWKFPSNIIAQYPNKVVNIHPALLPKYGGKGMYGINVHRAVLENKEKETGITIHYVDDNYDEGNIIFQQAIAVEECLTPEDVALKVLTLEHEHFPRIIEELLGD
ncbi:phosphoribosylglycinamide formyltransferase [Flavobacterium alkalisoli]|uniref:Phosphoribosylglycinamide formyltransferase n=1 Tax=Flavobacterium alkalisoli TaxID=2602769 RepID=A0A5B9FRT7_9FLAO|nr:phosphoribosylglycinamide formyltransferase [Flavobacterium alkalisoli]QEE48919.1 phosphoribosylglycinamide formyltransferase [Flavobacterium alkalisoli]